MTRVREIPATVRYSYSVNLPSRFTQWMRTLKNEARRNILSVAASSVSELVRKHLSEASRTRHETADRLGANRTGFLEEGARSGVTPRSTEDMAEVLIRVPGISRAFHDLTVTPKKSDALTIPLDALSYSRRVSEVRALGWKIVRPKGKNVLLGSKDGETRSLYALVKSATVEQDRGLLPSDEEISTYARHAIGEYLRRFSA